MSTTIKTTSNNTHHTYLLTIGVYPKGFALLRQSRTRFPLNQTLCFPCLKTHFQGNNTCTERSRTCPKSRSTCPDSLKTCSERLSTCLESFNTCPESSNTCPERRSTCPESCSTCPENCNTSNKKLIICIIKKIRKYKAHKTRQK